MTDPARPTSAWQRGQTPKAARGREERRPKQQTVRLACKCGRNLADLRLLIGGLSPRVITGLGPTKVAELRAFHPGPELVLPIPRPGVQQSEHHHRDGRITFQWDCRCGQTWEIRGDRIDAAWREHAQRGRTTRLVLGRDAM